MPMRALTQKELKEFMHMGRDAKEVGIPELYAYLDTGLEMLAIESDTSYKLTKFHVSESGSCITKLYYLYTSAPARTTIRRYRNATIMGSAHHEKFTDAFKKLGYYSDDSGIVLLGKDGMMSIDHHPFITGETDLTFHHLKTDTVVLADYKTSSHAGLYWGMKHNEMPKIDHQLQIQGYWYLLNMLPNFSIDKAFLIYEDKNLNQYVFRYSGMEFVQKKRDADFEGSLQIYEIEYDKTYGERMEKKFQRVITAIQNDAIPDRDHNDKWRCGVCPYVNCPHRMRPFYGD